MQDGGSKNEDQRRCRTVDKDKVWMAFRVVVNKGQAGNQTTERSEKGGEK